MGMPPAQTRPSVPIKVWQFVSPDPQGVVVVADLVIVEEEDEEGGMDEREVLVLVPVGTDTANVCGQSSNGHRQIGPPPAVPCAICAKCSSPWPWPPWPRTRTVGEESDAVPVPVVVVLAMNVC